MTAELLTTSSGSDIFVECETPYVNSRARSYFQYEFLVGSSVVARAPGGIKARTFLLAMTGIPKDTSFSLRIRCLRNAQATSWERATRIRVLRVSCSPTKQGIPAYFADDPDVEIIS